MSKLHPRNLHQQGYDFPALVKSYPLLASYVKPNAYGNLSIDFANPMAVKVLEKALKASQLKLSNLERNRGEKKTNSQPSKLNFGGLEAELWCKGGEQLFLKKLIKESRVFSEQCHWFTSLVSKSYNIKPSIKLIKKLGATDSRVIEMKQGNKISRILAWTFL